MDEPLRRRRRVRTPAETETETEARLVVDPATTADSATQATGLADEPAGWVGEAGDADGIPAERGLRGLVGGGSSQVSPAAAMRARDAARPRAADLARAEAELTIVRRHWSPRDELPPPTRPLRRS